MTKAWRRAKKIELIESMNPHWNDLAKDWGKQMARLHAIDNPG